MTTCCRRPLGPAPWSARRARTRGVLAEVKRGTFVGDNVPLVQLATSTVRFLVPGDIGFARCDCTLRTACEHVVLAVWAFREADRLNPDAVSLTVSVAAQTARSADLLDDGLGAADDLAGELLLDGAVHTSPSSGARFALARAALERARAAWPLDALDEVEDLLEAYRRHSARYAPARFAAVLAELRARRRAATHGQILPPAAVLGTDEALETKLDRMRLIGLGARAHADGRERSAEVFFCDPSTSAVLVVKRTWTYAEAETPEDGPALGKRMVLGATLHDLASSQIVSTAGTRKPSRLLAFSTGPLAKTTVLKQTGDLDAFPRELVIDDVDAFGKVRKDRPPRMLRPRLAAGELRVVAASKVDVVGFDAGEQAVRAQLRNLKGTAFVVERSHRVVAAGALPALVRALRGPVRGVVGDVRTDERGLVVDPIAVIEERVVALDTSPVHPDGARLLAQLPGVAAHASTSPLEHALARLVDVLGDAAHDGLRHAPPGFRERLDEAQARVRELGLTRLADDVKTLRESHAKARSSGLADDESALVDAWTHAMTRALVMRERLSQAGRQAPVLLPVPKPNQNLK